MLREELISNFTGAGSNHTYRAALLEQAGYCAGYGTAPMASISTSKDSLTIDGYFFDTLFEVSKSTVQRVELDPITLKSNDWECLKVQKECWEERLEMHAAIQLHAPKSLTKTRTQSGLNFWSSTNIFLLLHPRKLMPISSTVSWHL